MDADFESRVRKTGLELYELMGEMKPVLFDTDSWAGRIMAACMNNSKFKVAMFRFMDVLPYLDTTESLVKHIVEYFGQDENFPEDVQLGKPDLSSISNAIKKKADGIASNIRALGGRFIAGRTPEKTIPVIDELRSQGMAFSADILGEAVLSEKEADAYLERYLAYMDLLNASQEKWPALGAQGGRLDWGFAPKINLSLKPSAMYSQMNTRAFDYAIDRAKERLRPIFRKAMDIGAHVCLDMEQYDLKNLTLALYRSIAEEPEFKDYPYTGTVIQSYLKHCEQDLRDLVDWAEKRGQRITVRLAKGAYWDAEVVWASQRNWPAPMFTDKRKTDANFEKSARFLMGNKDWVDLACASQNVRSVAFVMESAKELGKAPTRVEYQVLYGMAEPFREALRKKGVPVRVYVPTGERIPGMAYLVRRLLENTSEDSFLRHNFYDGSPRETLLEPPDASKGEPEYPLEEAVGPFENAPQLDWGIQSNRERFRKALNRVRNAFPLRVPLFIGGQKIETGKEIRSTNPNKPEELVGVAASAGRQEAEQAVRIAKSVFPAWRDTDPRDRAEVLFQAAEVIKNRRYDLAALEVYEVGKSWTEADADVCEAIDFMGYYGREMMRLARPRPMRHVPGELSHLHYEPRGVAAVIAPWNFPLAISAGMTSAAIVTGNTVVYKPASNSCVTGSKLFDIFREAGLPPGVLNFLPGSGEDAGNFIVRHPDVSLIAFTGSKEVGLDIIEAAGKTPERAEHVKRVVAEMGGKNAVIVDEDADLDEAVMHIIHSAFGYQGQKCSACSRLIVLETVYKRLVDRLIAAARSIEIGPPEDPKNFIGAVIDEAAREKILHYIEIGKREGACLLERAVPGAEGHFVPLTIFADIEPHDRIAQEEIFGPVLAVIQVKDFDEALEVANGTSYALTGGLFSRSPERVAKAKKEFRVGNLYINRGCTGAIVGRHPFGGFKMSGVGSKAGGPDYLLQFMLPKNVVENTLRRGFAPPSQ